MYIRAMILDSTWESIDDNTNLVTDSRQIPAGDPGLSRETQYKLKRTDCSF